MAIFDIESGAQGASTAGTLSGFNPYAVAAGFVVGGFVGGSAKSKAKKRAKKLRRKLRQMATPEFLASLIEKQVPLNRANLLATGVGQRIKESTLSNISNLNLSGTGRGAALSTAASGALDLRAFSSAVEQGRGLQDLAIGVETGLIPITQQINQPNNANALSSIAEIAALFDRQRAPEDRGTSIFRRRRPEVAPLNVADPAVGGANFAFG